MILLPFSHGEYSICMELTIRHKVMQNIPHACTNDNVGVILHLETTKH